MQHWHSFLSLFLVLLDSWCVSFDLRSLSNGRIAAGRFGGRSHLSEHRYGSDNEGNGFNDQDLGYWESDTPKPDSDQRGGLYKVYFDAEIDSVKETRLDWETYLEGDNEALVLLPPEAVERPSAVLHFVGGTFFGSTPKLWYKSFLEGLVRNTQCAVIVTPIPVTLLKSPLEHVSLSRKLQKSFERAWQVILEDEYGDLSDIPLCGVGHSLGARLFVVLATLTKNKGTRRIPAFKSFILISFTNYGAAAGIPGLSTLLRQSQRQERLETGTSRRNGGKRARRTQQAWRVEDDWEEDDDESWEEIVSDLQGILQEQANRLKSALTPTSSDLEFFPTPNMLWDAVRTDKRYAVPETLVVQFDDDAIDQSSKLADILRETDSSDVRFARLRGTHLTPIMAASDDSLFGFPPTASKSIWKALRGQRKSKKQEAMMRDLRQTIARYITDVVTK